ncbi:unnamed protein product [Clonostachys rosea f. rosea IK726]|uniref:Uncharacterized protein n=1 Tax=Clonostachys rosea f. rosea IK726 TaxID=1349383 RepID=A0ACA9TK22_BIOOC|nr:unnamed protein product [Clonostachys rosea f. rosea IK726]
MIIPRERRLVRFYVELCRRPDEDEKYGAEDILGKIVEILKPYHFLTQIVEWESTYSVGRRLCMGLSTRDVAFLVGDAIHTHSPKAGQGMNTSMQDAFNLGWKLAYVVRGMASSEILHTYHQERAPIAERLLKFDEEIYNAVSDKCHGNDASGLLGTLAKENTSASGLSVEYGRNLLVSDALRLSSVFLKLGSRLPDLHVLNHIDGHIWRVHSLLNISGQWSLLIFGADLTDQGQMQRLQTLAARLSAQHSIIQGISRRGKQLGFGGIRPYLIYSKLQDGVHLHKISSLFFPNEGALGFAYDRIFADPADATVLKQGGMNLHQMLGISRTGGMVLIRPDHHIAFGGALDEDVVLDDFLLKFCLVE